MTIDVNTEFAAERAGQLQQAQTQQATLDQRVAAGELQKLPDGRYKVLVGWDRGEYLSANGMPLHGLDTTLGEAALYTTTPAWHGLGNVVPGGTTDIEQVLNLGGINFEVEQRNARYNWKGSLRTAPDTFHNVRSDTGDSLGTVGKIYTPIQNRAAFSFLQELVDRYKVIWESAGASAGGRRVFVSMRLPDTVTVDADGINDEIIPFVVAINSHDGSSAFRVVVTPWRPVCANTERFAVRDAYTKWSIRHTPSATEQLAQARKTLGLSLKYYERFAAEETQLAHTDMAIAEFRKVVDELWPVDPDATDRSKNMAARRTDALTALFEQESDRCGRTAYAAERAVTGYLDHLAPRRKGTALSLELARAAAAIEGGDDEIKTRAHKRLMLLRQG